MRARWIGRAFALVAAVGCADGDNSGGGGRGAGAPVGGSQSVAGTGGVAGSPSFSNPDGSVNVPPPHMAPTAGSGTMFGDAGPCEVGQFCAPSGPDPDNCGTLEFVPDVERIVTPGNLLLIWDRSTSMTQNWNGMQRWRAAGPAMVNALMPLAGNLTIGAIFFPSQMPGADDGRVCLLPGCSCSVDPYTSLEQIGFQPGSEALQKLQGAAPSGVNPMYGPVGLAAPSDPRALALIGQTPTSEAVAAADVMLQNSDLMGTTAVAFVTDGEPNCRWDQAATVDTIAGWLSTRNIKTYVIGLPGNDIGSTGMVVLNALAQAGGTGQYIVPTDAMTLQQNLSAIVEETVKTGFNSCSMSLSPVPDVPDELLLIVDEPGAGVQQVPRDRGWSLSVDSGAARVEISGGLCDAAMGGRFSSIKFQYACPGSPPPPSLPPVE
jgi:hypothetical protein